MKGLETCGSIDKTISMIDYHGQTNMFLGSDGLEGETSLFTKSKPPAQTTTAAIQGQNQKGTKQMKKAG